MRLQLATIICTGALLFSSGTVMAQNIEPTVPVEQVKSANELS